MQQTLLVTLFVFLMSKFTCDDTEYYNRSAGTVFNRIYTPKFLLDVVVAGLSLAIWTQGIMSTSNASSPFIAFLLCYSQPALVTGLLILGKCLPLPKAAIDKRFEKALTNLK